MTKRGMKKEAKEIDMGKGFEELENIATWFESGETDLDQGLQKFERALEIASTLKKKLSAAENKIKEIKKKYE